MRTIKGEVTHAQIIERHNYSNLFHWNLQELITETPVLNTIHANIVTYHGLYSQSVIVVWNKHQKLSHTSGILVG